MTFRKPFILIYFLLAGYILNAQVSISGIIKDGTSKKPIEFATIALLSSIESSVIATTLTDRKGKFIFDSIYPGQYFLKASFISYEQKIIPITIANLALEMEMDIIFIPGTLKDVTVQSKRTLLKSSIDRRIYDVTQDIMAQAGSASDVLKNVPSVEVDLEGNVSLRGSGDVLILVNGRPSPLMGKSRAEVLQQLPANTIERIEVITNPSARYKPDGTAGIINIVLKKNIKSGFNGIVTANAGTASRYNGNVNFNYKIKNKSFRKLWDEKRLQA